jgi:electron transport complex protein RnfG
MRDLVKMAAILFIVCGISAGALAVVNLVTRQPIAAQAEIERREAFRMVMPGADEFRERVPAVEWEALRGGTSAGAVMSISTQGYSGPIAVAVGMDLEGRLTGLRVLSHTETPGLGARITGKEFSGQFRGLAAGDLKLRKDDPSTGKVDAITAATISSRAVTEAVRAAVERRAKGVKP